MSKHKVNLRNVVEQSIIPPGIYLAMVYDFIFQLPKGTEENPCPYPGVVNPTDEQIDECIDLGFYPLYMVVFEINEGVFAGRKVYSYLTTNPEIGVRGNAKNFMLFNFLKAIGLADIPDEIEIDPSEIINRTLKIKVVTKPNLSGPGENNSASGFYPLMK